MAETEQVSNEQAAEAVKQFSDEITATLSRWAPQLETLMGDFRDASLRPWRRLDVPWKRLDQLSQGNINYEYERLCRALMARMVALIESKGQRVASITTKLGDVTFTEKGIKAKLSMAEMGPELEHALVDSRGRMISLLLEDPAAYMGQRAPAQVDLDEPTLPLGTPPFNAETGVIQETGAADGWKTTMAAPTSVSQDSPRDRSDAMSPASEPNAVQSIIDPEARGYAHGVVGGSDEGNPYQPGTPDSNKWLVGQGRGEAENVDAFGKKLEGLQPGGRSAYKRRPRLLSGSRPVRH